jgi:hypothetical protein
VSASALVISIILSMGSLAWEYTHVGFSRFAVFFLIFGLLWLFSQWRNWDWFSSLGLFIAVFGAAIGLWLEFGTAWMLAGAAFALFAWDMSEFRRRLRPMIVDDYIRGMERRHIARLSLLILAGMFLVTIALLLQLQFTFEWGVFMVIVILLGVAQLVAWFRRQ